MMSGLFDLQPEAGRRALPRVLELAAKHGLHVEVVGLANTLDIPVNLEEHVAEIGRILAAHPNGFLEIANEPVHPSQSAEVQKPEVLAALAKRVPATVPVALGSIERGDGFGAGAYITWHAPRESGRGGWGHVLALAQGAGPSRALEEASGERRADWGRALSFSLAAATMFRDAFEPPRS